MGGKHQVFYKFFFPVGSYDNNHDIQIFDVDDVNLNLFSIGILSYSNEGGGV